jgi:hypothetical protein
MLNTTLAGPFNNTVLEAAISVVKDAGPKLIETIVNRLVPSPQHQGSEQVIFSPVGPDTNVSSQLSTVFISPPVETIVIVPSSNRSVYHPETFNTDTVRLLLLTNFSYSGE